MFQQHLHQQAIAENCSPWIVCCCTPSLCFINSSIGFGYICCFVCFLTRPLGKTIWYCIFVSFVFIRDGREMYTGVHNRWKQLSVFIRVAWGTFVRWFCISASCWFCVSCVCSVFLNCIIFVFLHRVYSSSSTISKLTTVFLQSCPRYVYLESGLHSDID